jgi:hypothetical protein
MANPKGRKGPGLGTIESLINRLDRDLDLDGSTFKNITLENPTATGTTTGWDHPAQGFMIPLVGWSNLSSANAYYGRDPYDARNETWDYTLSNFPGQTSYVGAARTSNFVATSACKVTKLRGWALASAHTQTMEVDLWIATPVDDDSADVVYTQVGSATSPSAENSNKVYDLNTTYSSDNALAAGDVLMFTVRRTTGGDGTNAIYFSVTLEIEFT